MQTRSKQRPSLIAVAAVAVLLVAGAFCASNIRTRGPFVIRTHDRHDIWDESTITRGWPIVYYESKTITWIATPFGGITYGWAPFTVEKKPQLDWHNPQYLAIIANLVVGSLAVVATAYAARYWVNHRSRPFQFELRTLFLIMTAVALAISMLDEGVLHWPALLSVPLAIGILSIPIAAGILMQQRFIRSDRKLSDLRARFSTLQ
ncbi:MAG: hypothetical protein KDA42_18685, partial [Planctomycetales bacterium]|nr:hypothetical protein [Planctomycetales bacterium]